MADYNSITEIPDLEGTDQAIALEFEEYIYSTIWDNRASMSEDLSAAVERDFFRFSVTQGATYKLTSRSAEEPELILYNSSGEAIAIDSNDTDGTSDNILDFVAPETGVYYVDAGWEQSPVNRVVSMLIYEDEDTISAYQGEDPVDNSNDDPVDNSNDDPTSVLDSKSGDDTNDDPQGTAFNGGQLFGEYYFGTEELDTINYDGYSFDEVEFSQNGPVDDLVSEDWAITYDYQNSKSGNVDKIFDIDRVQFDNYAVALDLDVHDSAGSALALIHATFGNYSDADTAGLWVNYSDNLYYDNGSGLAINNENINDHFVDVAEQMLNYYAPNGVSHENLLNLLSNNVLNQSLDSQTSSYFLPLLNEGDISQAEMIAFAAMSDDNTSQYENDIQLSGFVFNPDSVIA